MTILNISSIDDLANHKNQIVETVKQQGYCVLRGLFDSKKIREKLQPVLNHIDENEILSSSGTSPQEIKKNVVKWSIGGQSKVQEGLARFMVTVYNTFFSKDIFGLHSDFEKLIQVRDILADRKVCFDNQLLPQRYNGCRLQLYPSGGGFMGSHIDKRAIDTNSGKNDYIQLLLLLTQKGVDYQEGGGYIIKDGNFIDVETNSASGDVVVYNGDTLHGVADIDPRVSFDREKIKGRIVALVTIYENNLVL